MVSWLAIPLVLTYLARSRQIIRIYQNPAFGVAQIKDLTEIFVEKASEVRSFIHLWVCIEADSSKLRDVWTADIKKGEKTQMKINVLPGLSRMTLDVIGLAGQYKYVIQSWLVSWSWLRIRLQAQFAIDREERTSWSAPRFIEYAITNYNAHIAKSTRNFWDLYCESILAR